jgi:hypothetical protein
VLPAFNASVAADAFRLALFYVSCSLVYICIYSAIEIPSPTLAIVSLIAKSGAAGCPEGRLAEVMAQADDLDRRIRAMETGLLIVFDDGQYRLTRKGRRIATLFEFGSVIFGLPLGG